MARPTAKYNYKINQIASREACDTVILAKPKTIKTTLKTRL